MNRFLKSYFFIEILQIFTIINTYIWDTLFVTILGQTYLIKHIVHTENEYD